MEISALLKTENLINWLRSKNPNEKYTYGNGPRCGISTYFSEMGHPDLFASVHDIYTGDLVEKVLDNGYKTYTWQDAKIVGHLPVGWNEAARGNLFSLDQKEYTYGEMLRRLEHPSSESLDASKYFIPTLTMPDNIPMAEYHFTPTRRVLEPAE